VIHVQKGFHLFLKRGQSSKK